MNTLIECMKVSLVKCNIKYIYKEDSLNKSKLNIFIKRFNIISF
mgnify:CR=1 FL=1